MQDTPGDGIIHSHTLSHKEKRAARPAFFLPHRLLLRHDSAAPSTRQQAKTAHRPVFLARILGRAKRQSRANTALY